MLGAATILSATAQGPGRATWTLRGTTYFGELDGPPTPRVEALVAAFEGAGLPAEAVANVRTAEWSKLCQIVPAAAFSALTRLPYYLVCKTPALAELFVDLTRECAAVADAAGVALADYAAYNPRTLATAPRAEAVASMVARGTAMEANGLTEMRISMLQGPPARTSHGGGGDARLRGPYGRGPRRPRSPRPLRLRRRPRRRGAVLSAARPAYSAEVGR